MCKLSKEQTEFSMCRQSILLSEFVLVGLYCGFQSFFK